MVATSTQTDLITIDIGGPTWVEPSGATAGFNPAEETDYFIEGSSCISKAFNAVGIGGMCTDKTGIDTTIASGNAVFSWLYWGAPNTLAVLSSGGYRVLIGSTTANYKMWPIFGSDTYVYGGWVNAAVNPQASTGLSYGSPTVSTSVFGSVVYNVNAVGKGNPFGNDAIRHGRTIIVTGGDAGNGYSTFTTTAAINDLINNRWGLFQAITGGYLQKGLFLMGTSTNPVDFRDSNKNISIQDTTRVQSGFNGFEVRNSLSRVDWTNISITTLGQTSRGYFLVTDNADINFDTCTFTDMDTFVFKPLSTILTTTFRRCGVVTQGTAQFTGCRFESSSGTKAISADDVSKIDNCTFVSSGTGYAIEGFSTAGDYTIDGASFSGYAGVNGTTGNEALHVLATTGTVNIYVAGNPSVHTDGATVNVISGSVNVTVNVTKVDGEVISDARVLVVAKDATGPMPYNADVAITRTGSQADVTHNAHNMATSDKVQIKGAVQSEYNGVFTLTKDNDNAYHYTVTGTPATPATGTIKATYAALSGLTVSGVITMSRVFSSDQPITGKVRKSTSSGSLYKTSLVGGIIDSTTGYSTSIIMIPDE